MKKTEFNELKGLTIPVLVKKALQVKEELEALVIEKNMRQLKDKKAVNKKRKDVARILTVIRQKQLLSELESKVAEKEAVKEKNKTLNVERKARTRLSDSTTKSKVAGHAGKSI